MLHSNSSLFFSHMVQTALCSALKNLPLICLRITVVLPGGFLPRTEIERLSDRFSGSLRTLLVSTITSLHFLALKTLRKPREGNARPILPSIEHEHVWWRVARPQGKNDVQLVRMLPQRGEQIRKDLMDMEREDLMKFNVTVLAA